MAWRGTNALASWAWQGCDGNQAVVEVYTDAEAAELLLNGKRLGKKKIKNCRAVFKTKYAPGKLEAIAYDASGKEISRSQLVSAVGQTTISVVPEVRNAKPGDVVYVDISIVGENGVVESNADRKLTVNIAGGELLGFGSANPRTEERFDEGSYTTYYGKALAAVRVGKCTAIIVTDGVQTQTIKLSCT